MLKRGLQIVGEYYLSGVLLGVLALFVWIQPLPIFVAVGLFVAYGLVVCVLHSSLLQRGFIQAYADVRKEYLYVFLICIGVALLSLWGFKIETIIFSALFALFAYYSWDNRVTATGALVCLAICPVLLILKQDAYAEVVAIYAYYFLIVTVLLQLIEYKRHPENFEENEKV